MDASNTGFVLICAAFVLFMTPGLAFFYGGLGRRKNVANNIMASFAIIGIATVMWMAIGFSLSFGTDHVGLIGGFDYAFLEGVGQDPGPYAGTIPFLAFAMFQMMFAIIISSGFSELFITSSSLFCVYFNSSNEIISSPLSCYRQNRCIYPI